MCMYSPEQKGLASIGTILRIEKHQVLEDGRLLTHNIGERHGKHVSCTRAVDTFAGLCSACTYAWYALICHYI